MNYIIREKILDFLSTLIFLVFFGISVYLFKISGKILVEISVIDAIAIVLSVYRVSRMLVYEKVFSLIRYILHKYKKNPLMGSVNNLITCPWCTGVWVSLFLFDIYYLVPYSHIFIYIIAISALASPLVLLSNNLTLRNDLLKIQRDKESKKHTS